MLETETLWSWLWDRVMGRVDEMPWRDQRQVSEPFVADRLPDSSEQRGGGLERGVEKRAARISKEPVVLELHVGPHLQSMGGSEAEREGGGNQETPGGEVHGRGVREV